MAELGLKPLTRAVSCMLAAGGLMCFLAPGAAWSQNLIVNGSFETTTPAGATGYTTPFQNLATNAVPGWNFGSSAGNSYDGILQSALLGPSGVIENGGNCAFDQGTGWFSQSVALTPGIYQLSFYAMGRVDGLGPDPLTVTLGSLFSETVAPTNAADNESSDWNIYTYDFQVTKAAPYILEFAGTIPFGTRDTTTYVDNVSLVLLANNLIFNGSFETPSITSDEYTTVFGSLPTNGVPGWTFNGSDSDGNSNNFDGLATFDGVLGVKSIEDGINAAFVQGTGSISQSVALSLGDYRLSYYLMGRVSEGNGANPTLVSLSDLLSVTNTPGNTAQTTTNDWTLYSHDFSVTNTGKHKLQFGGTIPFGASDLTTFIDNIALFPLLTITAPAPQLLYAGETARFTVAASGTTPVHFQWQENGTTVNNGGQIDGSGSQTLTITGVSAANAGNYSVLVSNPRNGLEMDDLA